MSSKSSGFTTGLNSCMDRRTFAKAMGTLSAMAVAGAGIGMQKNADAADDAEFPTPQVGKPVEARVDVSTGEVTVNEDVIVRYSACLGCYSSCGNRIKIDRATGRMLTIGGNPYHPNNAFPYLNFDEPLTKAYLSMSYANGEGNETRGTLCGRGQGTQSTYEQPDRITTPLKRAGKRGEGKWKPISWNQLITEVTEGGKLFEDLGEDTDIVGFKGLHDTETPMNADMPGLGPVSNQLVCFGGRGDGRAVLAARFASCYGTLNNYGHGAT
jgi:anaerobic selenocysteine-containing dehydrogenase